MWTIQRHLGCRYRNRNILIGIGILLSDDGFPVLPPIIISPSFSDVTEHSKDPFDLKKEEELNGTLSTILLVMEVKILKQPNKQKRSFYR